jgi:aspartyl-tRNA(Asn)/glutamyl-tRNA(Gln) amidotransferase subunit B
MELETIIGLEIHLQLKTKSKMFCSCSNNGENEAPNTTVCPICLGHPGTLPTVNEGAINLGVKLALALNCTVNQTSVWARKNYFYPDLPKGYQISQFDQPIASDGFVIVEAGGKKTRIGLERLHLEEDSAKNSHEAEEVLVDFNRAGTPLAEIVTKPEFTSPLQAGAFLRELRLLARYLKVSDADMEKGHLRCDANISLRPKGETKLYPKTEIKNLNSFRSVERALEYEISRQTELWLSGSPAEKESTRGWDEKGLKTVLQRVKEDAADYRYFPEPDLPPLVLTNDEIEKIKNSLPELPAVKRERLEEEYDLDSVSAKIIVEDEHLADYFENVMSEARAWLESLGEFDATNEEIWQAGKKKLSKLVTGWLLGELFKLMNETNSKITDIKINPENFAEFIALVYQKKINSSTAQTILAKMFAGGSSPTAIMEEEDLGQVDDDDLLNNVVTKIIADNPNQTTEYKAGKETLLKFFIGLAMKETKGKADPEKLTEIIKRKLSE